VGADPRRRLGKIGVHGEGICGSIGISVVRYHLRQIKMLRECGSHGCADVPGCVSDHEGHLLRGQVFGGYDEVAFVLPREVVENNQEFAIFWG